MCVEYPVIIIYTYLIHNDAKISVCLTFAGFLFHNEASDSSCLQTTCDISFCKLQQLPMLKGQPFLLLLCTLVILPSSLLQASLSPLQPPVTIILFYSLMGSTVSVPTLKRDLLAFLFSHSIYSLQNSTISKAKWSLILHIFYVCFLLHLLVADGYPLGWLQSIGEFFCGLVLPDFSSLSLRFTSGKSFPPV